MSIPGPLVKPVAVVLWRWPPRTDLICGPVPRVIPPRGFRTGLSSFFESEAVVDAYNNDDDGIDALGRVGLVASGLVVFVVVVAGIVVGVIGVEVELN